MKKSLPFRTLSGLALWAGATAALAHPGHSMEEVTHWHATDTLGFVVVAVLAAAAVWLSRK